MGQKQNVSFATMCRFTSFYLVVLQSIYGTQIWEIKQNRAHQVFIKNIMKNYYLLFKEKSQRDEWNKRGLGNSHVDHIQVDSVVIDCSSQETLPKHVIRVC